MSDIERRWIDSNLFILYTNRTVKRDAQRIADKWRKNGYLARVEKEGKIYRVWRSVKQAK